MPTGDLEAVDPNCDTMLLLPPSRWGRSGRPWHPGPANRLPGILRIWTVDVIDGINGGIYELYGGVIGIVAGLHHLKKAVMLPRSPQADSQRYYLEHGASFGDPVPMRVRRLMPALERENDMRGRFTKSPHNDSHRPCCPSPVFSSGYASMPGPADADRARREVDGSDPPI